MTNDKTTDLSRESLIPVLSRADFNSTAELFGVQSIPGVLLFRSKATSRNFGDKALLTELVGLKIFGQSFVFGGQRRRKTNVASGRKKR